ncbi:MAG: hypothetical protein Q4G69_00625 [Planctomycetia bacterium]|nr:hypothetical protein [Planctomycetia bacterium]
MIRLAIFLARCSLIPLILLGSWYGWQLSSEMYGRYAGFIFLTLWTFSPLVLAWGATICPDVAAASLAIAAICCFRKWLIAQNWTNALWAGITLGLLPLTKLTWILAFPIWIMIWSLISCCHYCQSKNHISSNNNQVIHGLSEINSFNSFSLKYKQFAMILLIAVYMINLGYGFDGSFKLLKNYQFRSQSLTGQPITGNISTSQTGNRFEQSLIGYLPVPLPGDFVQGIDTQKLDFERGIESYFHGQYAKHGWRHYYLYLLGVREPLGVWVLFTLTLGVTCLCRSEQSKFTEDILLLLPAFALFVFISSQTGFSIHPRYIILVLPFLYLWISKLGRIFERPRLIPKIIVAGLLIWIVISSLLWFPHSMSYFNEIVRSPWHGQYFTKENPPPLLGSNIDWGQNSRLIEKWYYSHPQCRPIYLDCSSPEPLERTGIIFSLPLKERKPGWYLLGINELFGSSNKYKDFQCKTPKKVLGYSIYIYYIPETEKKEK